MGGGEEIVGAEATKTTRDDGGTEEVREKLWALVERRVSGSCQPLWAKGPDTHGWRAVTLTTVGAETPNTQGP